LCETAESHADIQMPRGKLQSSGDSLPEIGGTQLKGTVEKGIDAAVITHLLTQALDDNYRHGEYLISGDAAMLPPWKYIQRKLTNRSSKRIFPQSWDELRKASGTISSLTT